MKILYVPYPDEPSAKKAAYKILSQNLAACCQVAPSVTSIYRWEDKIEENKETILWLKTTKNKHPALTSWLEQHHPYDVPCIATFDADCNASYLQWLNSEISPVNPTTA